MNEKPPGPVKRKALGRGIGSLLPPPPGAGQSAARIPVARIDPNPAQPRTRFDDDALRRLADSIRKDGLLQPVLVRPNGDRYTLIVGERRLRACKLAGLPAVEALVRDIPDDKLLEVTLVENIQRENLNPIEIALALQRMLTELGLVHGQLAARTGMSRAAVTNHLRLLKLPASVKELLREGRIRMGHARALLALERVAEREALARAAADSELSVREVERMARRLAKPKRKRAPRKTDPNVAAAIEKLERVLEAPVKLRQRGKKGRLEIFFSSEEQLAAIYDRIVGEPV